MLRVISDAMTPRVSTHAGESDNDTVALPTLRRPMITQSAPVPARPRPTRASHGAYIPGLDGLRALAVIAVLLYHADMPWAAGGFLGVDVFFVLSGYLITTLLHAEWTRHGSVNLAAFWRRRARRLLPALFVVLMAVLVFAVLFLHSEVAGLRAGTLAALVYVTNWYLIYGHLSYFASVGRPSPLQHLWSLAVEEQFYLVWPLLFVIGMRVVRQRGLLLLTLTGAGVSAILMASGYSPNMDPSRLYYGTDTRATALLLGAALALLLHGTHRATGIDIQDEMASGAAVSLPAWSREVVGFAGLAALAVCCVKLDAYAPFLYRGGFTLIALATVAVIAGTVHRQARALPALLGGRALRWIGVRSYGMYLWHWPVFTVTRPRLDVPFEGAPLLIIRLMLTVGLAALSYRYVEAPVRAGALGYVMPRMREALGVRRQRTRWLIVLSGIAVSCVGLVVTVATAQPAPPPAYLAISSIHSTSPARPTVRATQAPRATTLSMLPAVVIPTAAAPASASISLSATASPTVTIPATPTPFTRSPASVAAMPFTRIDVTAGIAVAAAELADRVIPNAPPPALPTPTGPAPTGVPPAPTVPATVPAPTAPGPEPTPTESAAAAVAPPPHVFAIGDSVMVGAAPALQDTFSDIEIDAAVSRQASTAIDLLRSRRDTGGLGDIVIVHMGTNGTFTAAEFDEMMQTLAGVPRVVFINLKVPRPWEAADNAVIAAGVQRYPNTILVDWHTAGNNHPEYFWDDGIHLRPDGAQAYAQLIADALAS